MIANDLMSSVTTDVPPYVGQSWIVWSKIVVVAPPTGSKNSPEVGLGPTIGTP